MLCTLKNNSSSPYPSTGFPILDLKSQAVRLPISKGSKILLSELLQWSGERRYCWWGAGSIAEELGLSTSAVWRYVGELKAAGFLASIERPGHSNYWIPLPGKLALDRVMREVGGVPFLGHIKENLFQNKNVCTHPESTPSPLEQERGNVLSLQHQEEQPNPEPPEVVRVPLEPEERTNDLISPTPKPCRTSRPSTQPTRPKHQGCKNPELLKEILGTTGDYKSTANWIYLINRVSEEEIRIGLSSLNVAMLESIVAKPGAYLNRVIRDRNPWLSSRPKTVSGPTREVVRIVQKGPILEPPSVEPICSHSRGLEWVKRFRAVLNGQATATDVVREMVLT